MKAFSIWAIIAFVSTTFIFGIWGASLISLIVVVRVLDHYAAYLPKLCQLPFYLVWKRRMQKMQIVDAAYPFSVVCEFELDYQFYSGGIGQAKKFIHDWLESYPQRMVQYFEEAKS